MKHYFHPVYVLIAGVLSAQVLFSVLVYFSNSSLHQNLLAIKNSGYIVVPNELVMPTLQYIVPAICGGLFFSLTTGAGLSFITLFLFWVWRRYSGQYWLLMFLFLAAAVFFATKFDYHFAVTLVCTLTVGSVIITALKFFPGKAEHNYPSITALSAHLAVIILIVLIWMPVANKDVFISIRDNLLLSNPIGQKINNFYYNYTLYPAETFKSLDQKLLKTCHITINDKKLYEQVKQHLISEDYLPVNKKFNADLNVAIEETRLIFLRNGKTIHQCSSSEFLSGSKKNLELISEKTDHNKFLRKITFLSLISASPLLCYIILHTFFMSGLFFVKSIRFRIFCASTVCLLIFTMPAISFYRQPLHDMDNADINKYIKSDNWQERVGALKSITDQSLSIDRYIEKDHLDQLVQSPFIAERYWLAQSLCSSRSKMSYQLIIKLLNDPQPNVVCMAMYSLGKQKNVITADEILHLLKDYNHWYVQWYAYKALKRMGWTQKKN